MFPPSETTILYVEDEAKYAISTLNLLQEAEYQVLYAPDEYAAKAEIQQKYDAGDGIDAAVLDANYGEGGDALGVIKTLLGKNPQCPIVFVSSMPIGTKNIETFARAIGQPEGQALIELQNRGRINDLGKERMKDSLLAVLSNLLSTAT